MSLHPSIPSLPPPTSPPFPLPSLPPFPPPASLNSACNRPMTPEQLSDNSLCCLVNFSPPNAEASTPDQPTHILEKCKRQLSTSTNTTISDSSIDSADDTDDEQTPTKKSWCNPSGPPASLLWKSQKSLKGDTCHNPNFHPNLSHLQSFCNKIQHIDRLAEFDKDDYRCVHCSCCSSWVLMQVLYKVQQFEEHRDTAKCIQNAEG
jgi:hypothetical protein